MGTRCSTERNSSIGCPPTFWLGLLVIYGLVFFFDWLPPLRYARVWQDPFTNLQQFIFPAMTLAFHDLAFTARVTRSSMLEVLRQDYVRTAHAKGLNESMVLKRHALRNALVPVITILGLRVAIIFGRTTIIETIFGLPGIGRFAVTGVLMRDLPVVQGVLLLSGTMVVSANLLTDVLYGYLDPRIRYD